MSLVRFPDFLFSGFLPQINIRFPRVLKIGFSEISSKKFFFRFSKKVFFPRNPIFRFHGFLKKFSQRSPFRIFFKIGFTLSGPSLRPCAARRARPLAGLRSLASGYAWMRIRMYMRVRIRRIHTRMRAFYEKLHLDVISNAVLSAVLL